MIVWFIRHLFYFRSLLYARVDPHEVALGCALGMMLGILPKGNLLVVLLSALVLALRMHLGAAMLSMFVFSIGGYSLDPITHRLGMLLLTNESLEPFLVRFYQLPLAPWTALNNSVVSGSLVLGMAAVVPAYWLSRRGVQWLQTRAEANQGSQCLHCESSEMPQPEQRPDGRNQSRTKDPASATA